MNSIQDNFLLSSGKFLKYKEYWVDKLSGDMAGTNVSFTGKNNSLHEREPGKVSFCLPDHVTARMIKISKNSDMSIYLILLAALKTLIHRYTGDTDIIVISPVYNSIASSETLNDFLPVRVQVNSHMTFKELLLEVRQSTLEAYANQDYPLEKLIEYFIDPHFTRDNNMLSNLVCRLIDIHGQQAPAYIGETVAFSFTREQNKICGEVSAPGGEGIQFYLKQISTHFVKLLDETMQNIRIEISSILFMPEEEKKRLLVDFNRTEARYTGPETIQGLFEWQVEKKPGNTALVFEDKQSMELHRLTYRELNIKTNQKAAVLLEKGIKPDSVVGIMVEHPLWMVVGLLAVLKAGGAYLPLDPAHPRERNNYIIANSGISCLLTETGLIAQKKDLLQCFDPVRIYRVDDETGYPSPADNPAIVNKSTDAAYVMYTSGTTGKPKGVLIEHGNVVNLLNWFGKTFQLKSDDNVLQLTDYTFDPSVEDIFGTLAHGAALHVGSKEMIANTEQFRQYVDNNRICLINFIPVFLKELLCAGERLKSLRIVISGGERLEDSVKDRIIEKGYTLYNNYGPTETATDALFSRCGQAGVTLGKPISNVTCCVLGYNGLAPVGIAGELYIAGAGVGRGYLNDPGLTAQKFVPNPLAPSSRMYRSGDRARWLPDGNIEFLGRKDNQVKIRGYRIELKEIEARLSGHIDINEAIVIANEDNSGEKYLTAYFIPAGNGNSSEEPGIDASQLRRYLSDILPDYMIPSYFVPLDSIPLSTNGKIDTRALPPPRVNISGEYIAPRNSVEKILAGIWAELLDLDREQIGIDANFFELGGHSLKATVMISKIYKEFQVKVPLGEVFNTHSIRGLSRCIKDLKTEKYAPLELAEKKEYYVLSSAQNRLYVLQQMDTESTGYNILMTLVLEEQFEWEGLEKTFCQLVKRHESLRTSFKIIDDLPVQIIHCQPGFKIRHYRMEGSGGLAEIVNGFVRPFDLSKLPLLRAALLESKSGEQILLLDMHHIITDGPSMDLLVKEFMSLYTGKEPTPLKFQYKDYAQWQNSAPQKQIRERQEEYWTRQFENGLPILNLPTDYARPSVKSAEGDVYRFALDTGQSGALNNLALTNGVTLYMVMLSVFSILLAKLCGQEDIVVGTPVAARGHPDIQQIIGMFINTVVMRTYPAETKTFPDFLQEVKKTSLAAFDNQEFPFDHLVDRLVKKRDTGRNPLFDALLSSSRLEEFTQNPGVLGVKGGVRDRQIPGHILEPYKLQYKTTKFDLHLFFTPQGDTISCVVEYCTKLFKKETIEKYSRYLKQILAAIVENPDREIQDIDMIGKKNRDRLILEMKEENKDVTTYDEYLQGTPETMEAEFEY